MPVPIPLPQSGSIGSNITPTLVFQAFSKRKTLVTVILVLSVLAAIYAARMPNDYLGVGKLEIRHGASRKFDITQLSLSGGGDEDDKVGTDVQILHSRTLALEIAKELHLDSNPAFFGVRRLKKSRSLDNPEDREEIAKRFDAIIDIERLPKTDVIVITANTPSPELSAKIVNSLMNQYIDHIFQTRFASTQRAATWLTGQIDDLKQQVESDQTKLVELQKKLGIVGMDQTHNLAVTAVEGLTEAETQASIERIVAEARYRILAETDPSLIEGQPGLLQDTRTGGAINSGLLTTLRASQATLTAQLAQLRAQFGPNYEAVKQTQAQLNATNKSIAAEEARIVNQAKVNYEAARQNEDMTQSRLAAERSTAFALHSDMVSYNLLQQDYLSHRSLYQGLIQRLREAGITSGLESSEVDIIDMADLPVNPSGKSHLVKALACLFFGMVIAIILVGIGEAFDTTIQDASTVESSTGLASFGVIPMTSATSERTPLAPGSDAPDAPMLGVLRHPLSQFSEAIRVLRTGLLFSMHSGGQRAIVFTSSAPSEGKSTISSNVAAAIAMGGETVLLIDADLRKPKQHNRFRISNTVGLSTYLSGQEAWRSAVQAIPSCPRLSVMTSGPIPFLPSELLSSAPMAELIAEATKEYGMVIIDAPPSGNLTDASILGQLAGATIFVVRYGVANRRHLVRAVQQAARNGANAKGFVLNAISDQSPDYYDYYRNGTYVYTPGQDSEKGQPNDI